jgi:ribose transport system substrate-binding protein
MKKQTYLYLIGLMVLGMALLIACGPAGSGVQVNPTEEPPPPTAAEASPVPEEPQEILGVTDEIKATKPWQIGYVIKDTTNPYYVRMTAGAETAGQDFDVEVAVVAPEEPGNVDQQIGLMEDLIQQEVDGIVIAPTDTNRLAPVTEKAIEAGIPVIALGTPLNTDKILTHTGFDNLAAGQMLGEWVADQLGGSGKVLILEGPPGQQNAIERRNGFLAGLQQSNIDVLGVESAHWHKDEAYEITKKWLDQFSEIDAIVAANDNMGLGAAQAIAEAGREGIIVTGFDANQDALVAIKDGQMHASVDQVPGRQARQAIQLMIRHLENGETFPEFLPWQDIIMANTENIDQFLN